MTAGRIQPGETLEDLVSELLDREFFSGWFAMIEIIEEAVGRRLRGLSMSARETWPLILLARVVTVFLVLIPDQLRGVRGNLTMPPMLSSSL